MRACLRTCAIRDPSGRGYYQQEEFKMMGKNMQHALEFIRKANGWCTYANDRATVDAIRRLEARGMVITNEYHQFRATS